MNQDVFYSPQRKSQVWKCLWETVNWREFSKRFSVSRKVSTHQLLLLQLGIFWSSDIKSSQWNPEMKEITRFNGEYEAKIRFPGSLTEISVTSVPWGVCLIQPSPSCDFCIEDLKKDLEY